MRLAMVWMTLIITVFTSGCASIVNGTSQPVSVVARTPENQEVVGARCTLTSSKGEWFTTTPGSVVVHRGYGDMTVACLHPVYSGTSVVKSTTKGMAFGNIIFGGIIGVAIDAGNGSAYDYPDLITVGMVTKAPAPDGVEAMPVVAPASVTVAPAVSVPFSAALAVPAVAVSSVATQPVAMNVAAPQPVPSRQTTTSGLPGGQDGYQAEHLAMASSCTTEPKAILTAKGPGFETYTVACKSGDVLTMRCEFGNCKVLR